MHLNPPEQTEAIWRKGHTLMSPIFRFQHSLFPSPYCLMRLQAQPCILYCVAALSGVWCCIHHSPVTMCGNNQHMIRLQWRFSITSDTARYFTQSKSLFHIPSSKNCLVAGGPVAGGGDKATVLLCKWVIPLSAAGEKCIEAPGSWPVSTSSIQSR